MSDDVNLLQSTKPVIYAIDASSANKDKRTGVENYAFNLIEAMKQQPLKEGERVVLFSPTPLSGQLAEFPKAWESRVLEWKPKRGWMQIRVSWELFRRKPSALFVPSQGLPRLLFGVPTITTIHDVGFKRIGNLYDSSVKRRIAAVTKRSLKKAKRLLTVSQFTKNELESAYKVKEQSIEVTPLSADTSVYRRLDSQTINAVLQKHRLGHNFFLYVGRLEKKKNIAMLIRAFELFKQNRGIGDPFELVLVGGPGYGYKEIKTHIDLSLQKENIRETGYLPDEDVAALMNIATTFLFPSLYEGFGIPNLEAMACGAPLITSDIPPHHEVVGDAGVFVSTQEPEDWAKQMARVVDDSQLRESLIEKGALQSAQFSWNKTAKQTWENLRGLI